MANASRSANTAMGSWRNWPAARDWAATSSFCYADPWGPPSATGVDKNASVLVLGTGLTMVDYVLSMLRDGHRGPIIAMSRRGLLPKAHRRVPPLRLEEAQI